jgi:NagD protein
VVRPPRRRFAGYALGLDGTVYLGDELVPGARETIEKIREDGARVIFVTNRPLETAADYAAKLCRLGIPTTADAVLTALDCLRLYLSERHLQSRLLLVAEPSVQSLVAAWGWTVVEDPAEAQIVVVSFDRTFDYAKLKAAHRAVVDYGASIVATNPDPCCLLPEGGVPDCGALLAALEACTGVRAGVVLGMPSAVMGRALLDRLGTAPADSVVVGDRLLTDVVMGQTIEMAGVLVLTGATSAELVVDSDIHPDYVIEGIHQLLP